MYSMGPKPHLLILEFVARALFHCNHIACLCTFKLRSKFIVFRPKHNTVISRNHFHVQFVNDKFKRCIAFIITTHQGIQWTC
ncbi:hypothetical protein CJ20_306 [Escherichia phage CJ20]|nr:hypothetical protein CJ20_306 [Escherichia phage CJ20]